MTRPLAATALICALTGLTACVGHELKPIELGRDPNGHREDCVFGSEALDILFVIDNSSSMADGQAKLARSLGALIERLDEHDVEYRLGLTTTDNGGPACSVGQTSPEAGNLVLSSCRERLDAFVSDEAGLDVRAQACEDLCALEPAALEIQPTRTESDATSTPRPWIERIDGRSNLPEPTDLGDAMACFVPQGIDGCGFEAPLESMYLALARAQTEGQPSYGFMRATARLAVVLVTDELDCSLNKQFSQIFDPEGARVFWADPKASEPNSALCWNAGVSCLAEPGEFDPSSYAACLAVNKSVDGEEWVEDELAVLHPLARYRDLLDGIEAKKQQINPSSEVIVQVIAGVSGDGQPVYADGDDAEFLAEYGIGPGCGPSKSPDQLPTDSRAVPPVRLAEFAQSYGDDNISSICASNYDDALARVAEVINAHSPATCYPLCVADLEPETPTLEADCTLEGRWGNEDSSFPIPECVRVDGAYVIEDADHVIPEGFDICHARLSDDPELALTPEISDDLSYECADANYNLEFEFQRRPGASEGRSLRLMGRCTLAEFPELACPGIGT